MVNTNRLRIWATKTGLLGMFKHLHTRKYFRYMNKKYHRYRISGEVPVPERFIFDLTFKCNLNCKMCFIHFPSMLRKKTLDGKMEMSAEQIKQAFDKIPKISHITLIGGEPFARGDIFEVLDYFKSRGALVRLSTNLTMLDDEKIERLKRYKNIEAIGTSLDGDREVHNNIRDPKNRKAFDKTIENIKKLRNHFFIGVLSVMLDDNLEELPKIIKIAKEAGAHLVTFEFERRYTKEGVKLSAEYLSFNPDDFPLNTCVDGFPKRSIEDYRKAIKAVEDAGKECGMPVGFYPILFKEKLDRYFYRNLDKEHFCKQLFIGRIDAQGNVIHCFAIRKPLGNLLKQSYEEIWNSDEYKELRKKLDNTILPICETCEKLVEYEKGEKIALFREMFEQQKSNENISEKSRA